MNGTTTTYGIDLDEFVSHYLEAALWATLDCAGDGAGDDSSDHQNLDANYSDDDIAPESMAKVRAECLAFLNDPNGGGMIARAEEMRDAGEWCNPGECSVTAYAGHDFFMTRAGHGVGFWDGDWPDGIGEALDKLAKSFGSSDPYVGGDGRIYF
jgi:hypothetical protein